MTSAGMCACYRMLTASICCFPLSSFNHLTEEQEERRRKKKWNERFLQFVKDVEEKLARDPAAPKIEFDIPYKELSFTGVPNKQQVTIMPTVHSLVALDDNPPMVVNLNEVEIGE